MMKILYEDKHIVCVEKPVGMLSQHGAEDSRVDDLVTALTARETENSNPAPYIGVVHRLDAGVGGAMVYANQPLVIINHSNATPDDVMSLAQSIQKRVSDKFGIELQREVIYV